MCFKLLTSCWCSSLVRLSSLAWLSFNFCISVCSRSIYSFNTSISLCSWVFSFSSRFTLLPPRREFSPLSGVVAIFVVEFFSSSVFTSTLIRARSFFAYSASAITALAFSCSSSSCVMFACKSSPCAMRLR